MTPKKEATPKETYERARKIRAKIRKGTATPLERSWLTNYEAKRKQSGRPSREAIAAEEEQLRAELAADEKRPADASASAAPDVPAMDLPPLEVGTPTDTPATDTPKSDEGEAKKEAPPAPSSSPAPKDEHTGKFMAEAYTAGFVWWNKRAAEKGMIPVPQGIVDAGALGVRFLADKYLGGVMDEDTRAALAVAAPPVVAGLQEWELHKKKSNPIFTPPEVPIEVKATEETPPNGENKAPRRVVRVDETNPTSGLFATNEA